MKEIKTFFNNDNKLNKGYARLSNPRETDLILYHKKFAHILPPVDLISEYENIHPGTLAKLIRMAEEEQKARQALEIARIEATKRATEMGKAFALIVMALICLTTIILVLLGHILTGTIFAASAFLSIAAISYLPSLKSLSTIKNYPVSQKNKRFIPQKK